jgi:hypothetical protein
MRRHKHVGLVVALLMTACSSTQPQAATVPASAERPNTRDIGAVTPTSIPLDNEGPVTPSMVGLQLSGERYAALGDPAAPVTMVEVSDFG